MTRFRESKLGVDLLETPNSAHGNLLRPEEPDKKNPILTDVVAAVLLDSDLHSELTLNAFQAGQTPFASG